MVSVLARDDVESTAQKLRIVSIPRANKSVVWVSAESVQFLHLGDEVHEVHVRERSAEEQERSPTTDFGKCTTVLHRGVGYAAVLLVPGDHLECAPFRFVDVYAKAREIPVDSSEKAMESPESRWCGRVQRL